MKVTGDGWSIERSSEMWVYFATRRDRFIAGTSRRWWGAVAQMARFRWQTR